MNAAVSIGEYHGLRVGSALLSIVAGCIIIGVSRDCDADAVGGIFLGAGGLGLLISVYPFIRAWFNFHHILPTLGKILHKPRPGAASGHHQTRWCVCAELFFLCIYNLQSYIGSYMIQKNYPYKTTYGLYVQYVYYTCVQEVFFFYEGSGFL
uniref:Kinocilin n=1 Tax=Denticeps clupeoides TaxID=299321 RepID=A0AAY4C2X6_9TELE